MSTLGEKLAEATAGALASAETMTALGTKTKALQKELEAAQNRSKNEIEVLTQKVSMSCVCVQHGKLVAMTTGKDDHCTSIATGALRVQE